MLLQDAQDVERRNREREEDQYGPMSHVSTFPSQPMQGHGKKGERRHQETPEAKEL